MSSKGEAEGLEVDVKASLFVPKDYTIMGEVAKLESVVVVSTMEYSRAAAFLCSQTKRRFITGFDIAKREIRPLVAEDIALFSKSATLFEHTESYSALASLAGLEAMEGREDRIRLTEQSQGLFAIISAGLRTVKPNEPIKLNLFPSADRLPYEMGCMVSSRNCNEGRFELSGDERTVYRGLSARLTYVADLKAGAVRYSINGGFSKGVCKAGHHVVTLRPIPLLHLQDRRVGYLRTHGMDEKDIVAFLIMSEDCGANGVSFGGMDTVNERLFEVTFAVKNLVLKGGPFSFGDVRFLEETDSSEEFDAEFDSMPGPKCLVAVFVIANDFAEALNKAMPRVDRALSLISFTANQDRVLDMFGQSPEANIWDLAGCPLRPSRSSLVFIEDCDFGKSLVQGNGGSRIEKACKFDAVAGAKELAAFARLAESRKTKQPNYIFNAVVWLEKARYAERKEEKIINLNTSLEFAITEEKGITLLEEIAQNRGCKDQEKCEVALEKLRGLLEGLDFNLPYEVDAREEQKDKARIASQLKRALGTHSFNSRLDCMYTRLNNPITKDELDVLHRCNKVRNGLVHGRKVEIPNIADIEKAISAASALIASKAIDLAKGGLDECS